MSACCSMKCQVPAVEKHENVSLLDFTACENVGCQKIDVYLKRALILRCKHVEKSVAATVRNRIARLHIAQQSKRPTALVLKG